MIKFFLVGDKSDSYNQIKEVASNKELFELEEYAHFSQVKDSLLNSHKNNLAVISVLWCPNEKSIKETLAFVTSITGALKEGPIKMIILYNQIDKKIESEFLRLHVSELVREPIKIKVFEFKIKMLVKVLEKKMNQKKGNEEEKLFTRNESNKVNEQKDLNKNPNSKSDIKNFRSILQMEKDKKINGSQNTNTKLSFSRSETAKLILRSREDKFQRLSNLIEKSINKESSAHTKVIVDTVNDTNFGLLMDVKLVDIVQNEKALDVSIDQLLRFLSDQVPALNFILINLDNNQVLYSGDKEIPKGTKLSSEVLKEKFSKHKISIKQMMMCLSWDKDEKLGNYYLQQTKRYVEKLMDAA